MNIQPTQHSEIRIMITDDHPVVIDGIKSMLRYHPDIHILKTFTNGAELLEHLLHEQPDVLLLDIQMPGQQGDELAKIITKKFPGISILAFTNLDSPYYIKGMLQHDGVLGYILKTSGNEELLKAIRTVANGKKYVEPVLKERMLQTTRPIINDSNNPALTRRELEVLQLIANNFSSHEIAKELFLSKRTVDNHRISLLLKLNVKNPAGLVKKGLELGLIK